MKRHILTLIAVLATVAGASAMSYRQAREEALYLTDKMAYDLNLNNQQYNDADEINLDYFLSMNSERDLYGDYLSYRLTDLRHILLSWQFDLMLQADYFVRPLLWSRGRWMFPVYGHYRRGMFFYDRPRVYFEYRGGHGHHHYHGGFYADRRPHWDGGMRGREPMGGPGRGAGRVNPGRGNGYHFDLPGQGGRNPGRDNRPGRGDNGVTNGRDNRPGRGGESATPGRGDRPGRGDYTRGGSRNGYTTGRTDRPQDKEDGYTHTGRDSHSRQGQATGTRTNDRSNTTPNRNTGNATRPGSDSQPRTRGGSFSRNSSRVTSESNGQAGHSRGGSMSRGSAGTQTRSGNTGSPTRGGASDGGTVSRGRR